MEELTHSRVAGGCNESSHVLADLWVLLPFFMCVGLDPAEDLLFGIVRRRQVPPARPWRF
jgi:hypothetical protein